MQGRGVASAPERAKAVPRPAPHGALPVIRPLDRTGVCRAKPSVGIDHAGSGDPRGDGASPRMWRRLEATPAFDSRTQGPLAGVRALKAGFPRLIYEAAGYAIVATPREGARQDYWMEKRLS